MTDHPKLLEEARRSVREIEDATEHWPCETADDQQFINSLNLLLSRTRRLAAALETALPTEPGKVLPADMDIRGTLFRAGSSLSAVRGVLEGWYDEITAARAAAVRNSWWGRPPWDDISPEKARARWVLQDHEGYGLHEHTAKLVRKFAFVLGEKLRKAEQKYGYSDGWASADWEDECRARLAEHALKGDPLDVAAYAAFCWHHGWTTAPPTPLVEAGTLSEAVLWEANKALNSGGDIWAGPISVVALGVLTSWAREALTTHPAAEPEN